jgi:hypothetical protein
MAEIAPPRIEPIADPGTGPQDQSAQNQHAKAAALAKAVPKKPPDIGSPGEDEKHKLDELA